MIVEQKLKDLGFDVPDTPAAAAGNVRNFSRIGNVVYLSGHGPKQNGVVGPQFTGKLGRELTTRQGYEAARLTTFNLLVSLKQAIGDLDNVRQIAKLLVMVNSTDDFTEQPLVAHGASEFLVDLFGEAGKHARSAVGMGQLPNNMAVEIEMIVEVEV